jgi:hypothetical protein
VRLLYFLLLIIIFIETAHSQITRSLLSCHLHRQIIIPSPQMLSAVVSLGARHKLSLVVWLVLGTCTTTDYARAHSLRLRVKLKCVRQRTAHIEIRVGCVCK